MEYKTIMQLLRVVLLIWTFVHQVSGQNNTTISPTATTPATATITSSSPLPRTESTTVTTSVLTSMTTTSTTSNDTITTGSTTESATNLSNGVTTSNNTAPSLPTLSSTTISSDTTTNTPETSGDDNITTSTGTTSNETSVTTFTVTTGSVATTTSAIIQTTTPASTTVSTTSAATPESTTARATTFEPSTSPTTVVITTPEKPEPSSTRTSSLSSTSEKPAAAGTDWVLPVLIVLFLLVLAVFLAVVYMYCKGKGLPCMAKSGDEGQTIPLTDAVPSSRPEYAAGHMTINEEDFESTHKRKVADDGRGYREEFRAVQTESSSTSVARDSSNGPKNRYDNVVPYDSTRVKLTVVGDAGSDYINANYVPGYMQEKKFIACQGPKENTCADFWKMMWEQNCVTIVMVTNLVEAKKLKCHQYWPGEDDQVGESAKYGLYTVTTVDVKTRTFYVMRTFKLQYLEFPPRIIRHLHYTAWPDFGVPKNPHELLLFRRRVIDANPPHSGPIVVHCSAGVGRTGTFILVDAAMEQLQAEGKVDLFSFLTKMRKYRMMLVQTDAQYTFAHAVILEHIKYGETETSVKKFRSQVQALREEIEGTSDTGLDELFSSLTRVQINKDNLKHGRQSIKKNRVLQIIPYDTNRVILPLKPGQERSDYINASFIEGFKDRHAFIATQGPLNDTVADFWLMLWVQKCQNIVMLTALVEKGNDMCTRYWPENLNDETTFGDITVKYVNQDDDDVVDYIVREFVITNTAAPDEGEHKVRQFHYTGWPEHGLPTDAHGMIEIANRLSSKDSTGNSRPTAVHCSSGGGRTGVFIALNILMEQADCEGLVDVFQTCKSLRAQRPHIIQTQEQLYFCYAALLQYLESNQLAGDNATLSSNINSSIENQSSSVAASNGVTGPTSLLRVEDTTPQGSMNNKLDLSSLPDQGSKSNGKTIMVTDLDAPDVADESAGSPATQSADSVSQSLLKKDDDDDEGNSASSSDFEILNESAITV